MLDAPIGKDGISKGVNTKKLFIFAATVLDPHKIQ